MTLEGLTWKPRWTSQFGCLQGCAEYLGLEMEPAWLFGAGGQAFALNIHREVLCPSGPTAWRTEGMHGLPANLGLARECIFSHRGSDDFATASARVWEAARSALKRELPCYAWELKVPEYYVITGVTDQGYLFAGPSAEPGEVKPWAELGQSEIGVIEFCSVRRGEPVSTRRTVRDALAFALRLAAPDNPYVFEGYAAGPAAYSVWREALERGADAHGAAYNAQVWAECRGFVPRFLRLAGQALTASQSGFERAAGFYAVVAGELARMAELFPFEGDREAHVADAPRVRQAGEHLEEAREAETRGLEVLARLVESL